jgi:hypothetical protein
VHFDTHEKARKVGRRRVFLPLGADSRQDYVTARALFTAQDTDQAHSRNEYFTKVGNFSYNFNPEADGIPRLPRYQ